MSAGKAAAGWPPRAADRPKPLSLAAMPPPGRGFLCQRREVSPGSEDYAEGGTKIERYRESERWVVAGFHSWGRGRASGVPLDVRWAAIFELRGRRVTRVDVLGSYEKVIEAAEHRA